MRSAVAAAALLAVLVATGGLAAAQEHGTPAPGAGPVADGAVTHVSMRGKSFRPGRLELLVGETVTWVNDDFADHEVADDEGAFRSRRLMAGMRFSHTYDQQGSFTYHCPLHPFMKGGVDVFALALSGPRSGVAAGELATLSGRAPAGVTAVEIERRGDDGGWHGVSTVQPGADMTFAAHVEPGAPAVYRARAGELASRPVGVTLAAALTLRAQRAHGAVRLVATAAPRQSGAHVVLQRWLRERFDWRTVATGRFDRRSRKVFTVRSRRSETFRAMLTRGVAGYGTSVSRAVRVHRRAKPRHH